nr:MAG TPA_asm: hypothetical protein [Caudoviricetes sp.]
MHFSRKIWRKSSQKRIERTGVLFLPVQRGQNRAQKTASQGSK